MKQAKNDVESPRRSWAGIAILILGALVLLLRFVSEAWIGEDALITFRTIDNFVNGYGLRWNIDERVQVYTHPLWLFLNTIPYAITREVPYTLASVCLVCSLGAYVIVARRLVGHPALLLLGFFLPFAASRTLVFYGTSGFETPLGFLLLAAFAVVLLPADGDRPIRWGWLTACAALAAVNRLDYVLLLGPALLYCCVTGWRQVKWGRLLLGATPLVAWLLFSLLYHGFLVPNTAPAKLCEGIPVSAYLHEGLIYTAQLIRFDPASVPILVAALVIAAAAARRWSSGGGDDRSGRVAALGVGVFLYGGYVLWIGGGFLSGRFWAPPLFLAILVVALGAEEFVKELRESRPRWKAVTAFAAMALLIASFTFGHRFTREGLGPIYHRSLAHYTLESDLTWSRSETAEKWWAAGLRFKRLAQESQGRYVKTLAVIGFKGLAAGPEVTVIDTHGLADPLLARLPLDPQEEWRPGHIKRAVPPGYLVARQTGSLDGMEPGLREYYRHLQLIVAGPIFAGERLRTLISFNLGRYDHLLEE